jgi:phosphoketolase
VRGYKEKGNINTPMELAINNQTDRFSLAIDAIDRIPKLQRIGAHAKEVFRDLQIACRRHAYEYGINSTEISGWKWPANAEVSKRLPRLFPGIAVGAITTVEPHDCPAVG